MHLPQTSKHALQALTFLALHNEGYISSKDLSKEIGMPPSFLSKIMRRLVTHRLLEVKKGPQGGFRLARSPGRIRFFDILAAVGYPFKTKHCLFGWKKCGWAHPCPLHSPWNQINEAFSRWAKKTTLADVLPGKN